MTHPAPFFSVIIPAYNLENEIVGCLDSLNQQEDSLGLFEAIVVDDVSTDQTCRIVEQFESTYQLRLCKNTSNEGPGGARNRGMDVAEGEYLMFLDGDDFLPRWSLARLATAARKSMPDLVAYNWAQVGNRENWAVVKKCELTPRRRDLDVFAESRRIRCQKYLGMNCDGSVIYTAARRDLFQAHAIRFPLGLHEDISVLFALSAMAEAIEILDEVCYLKHDRPGSIVNTISEHHIDGRLRAWLDMRQFLVNHEGEAEFDRVYGEHFLSGVRGAVAVAIRVIFSQAGCGAEERRSLLGVLYHRAIELFPELLQYREPGNSSHYDRLAAALVREGRQAQGEEGQFFERYERIFQALEQSRDIPTG